MATRWASPSTVFTVLSTMDQACSSGVPLPSSGGGEPSPLPRPVRLALLGPSLLRLLVVGNIQLGDPPPSSSSLLSVSGVDPPSLSCVLCTRSACCYLGGAPPLPFLVGGYPPLPLLQVVREDRALVLEGCPPLPRLLAARWGFLPPDQGVPLRPLDVCGRRALLGGGSAPLPPPIGVTS